MLFSLGIVFMSSVSGSKQSQRVGPGKDMVFQWNESTAAITTTRTLQLTSTKGQLTKNLLSFKPVLGHIQCLVKNVILRILRCNFFYVEISNRILQASYGIANKFKNVRIAGSQKIANLSRDTWYIKDCLLIYRTNTLLNLKSELSQGLFSEKVMEFHCLTDTMVWRQLLWGWINDFGGKSNCLHLLSSRL